MKNMQRNLPLVLNWCRSSELQLTHGKGRGSTILNKQNIAAVQEK